jgi:hypothetical protein
MRKAWWMVVLGAVSVLGLAGCEVDEGTGDAGGTDGGGDAGGDTGGSALCPDDTILADSCLSEFFSCFNPSGDCTVEERDPIADVNFSAIVFDNGAEWEVGRDVVDGDVEMTATNDPAGANCARATGSEVVEGERTVDWLHPGDAAPTLSWETDSSGNLIVTCPGGAEEIYTAAQADTLFDCLGASCDGDTL